VLIQEGGVKIGLEKRDSGIAFLGDLNWGNPISFDTSVPVGLSAAEK
jgi:hypothetical protein